MSPVTLTGSWGMVGQVMKPLRVLTFNILTGHDLYGRLDLGRTADVIAATEPDVVGLQEVDRHYAERSEYADQTAELADRLGWSGEFSPGLDSDPEPGRSQRRQFGDAILTPHRIVRFTAHRLENLPSDDPGLETRGVGHAELEIAGRRLQVFNTHLDHRWPEHRQHQAQQVRALIDATAGPAVVTGDFNAAREDAEVEIIGSGFADAAADLDPQAALTFPSDVPNRRLDYVFARELRPVRAAVLNVRTSDHRPLLAELSWPA